MNTTLSRSLALLVSMFALTSSFSLSMDFVESSEENMKRSTPTVRISKPNNEKDPWIVEMVDLENTGISTKYFVKNGMPPEQNKQNSSAFYDEIMGYESIKSFIEEPNETVDSIFRVSTSNSQSATVGIISKDNESDGYKLHLFCALFAQQRLYPQQEYLLDKTNNTFFAKKEMEETEDGILKLYFNGHGEKIIEVKTMKYSDLNIGSCSNYLAEQTYIPNKDTEKITSSKHNSRDKNSHILFWSSIFIAFAFTAIYVIYKYWWLPRKRSL